MSSAKPENCFKFESQNKAQKPQNLKMLTIFVNGQYFIVMGVWNLMLSLKFKTASGIDQPSFWHDQVRSFPIFPVAQIVSHLTH